MKISIIIPCYNEKNTIVALVKSVKKEHRNNCEIIIVDDGSFDGTRDLLKRKKLKEKSLM